jgi:hypothetical protein
LFVKVDILSEDVILKCYKDGHSVRGKMLFQSRWRSLLNGYRMLKNVNMTVNM